ncbi:MAG: DUF6515 family protein [Calditrichia bacterium]
MGRKFSNRAFLFIIAGLIIFSLNSEIFAQKRVVKRAPRRHGKAIVKLPQNHTRIVVNKRPYYFHHGVFYRKGSHGYAIVRAPLGARIRALPFGYISLRIGELPFFYYYGTYYRYLPREKVYVVVENPERSSNGNYAADRIYLVDGTTRLKLMEKFRKYL